MTTALRVLLAASMVWGMLVQPVSVFAEAGSEEAFFADIPIVFAASKRAERVTEAPANTIIITDQEIRERGYRNLKDVLADLPGMETIDPSASEFYGTMVPVRGVIGNNKIVLLVNGMRVNPPGGEFLPVKHDQSVRFAKRIEVVYGPGSALYGADAVSAVINIVTKDAYDGDKVNSLNLSGGMANTIEASAGFGRKFKDVAVTAYGQIYSSDETNYNKEYPDYSAKRKSNLSTAGRRESDSFYRWNKGQNFFVGLRKEDSSLQYWYRESDRPTPIALTSNHFFSPEGRWIDRSHVMRVQQVSHFTDNLSMTNSLTYNQLEIDPRSKFTFNTNYGDSKYGRGSSMELESLLNWKALPDKLDVIFGASWTDHEVVPKATVAGGFDEALDLVGQNADFFYWDNQADATANNVTTRKSAKRLANLKYDRSAVYAQFDWRVADRLKLVAGARYDDDSRYEGVINPRASMIYNPTDSLTTKYVYGQAYVVQPPHFTNDVFENGTIQTIPAPGLKPEKATSHEVNVNYRNGGFEVNAALYHNEQEDLFLRSASVPSSLSLGTVWVRNASGTGVSRRLHHGINLGESTVNGLDLLFKQKFGRHSAFLAYTGLDAEFEGAPGTPSTGLDKLSTHNVRLGGTYYLMERWFVSPRVTWRSNPKLRNGQPATSETPTSTENSPNGQSYDMIKGLYQIDLYSSFGLMESLDLYTRVSNLTNHKYMLRGDRDGANVPAETFRAELGVEWRY